MVEVKACRIKLKKIVLGAEAFFLAVGRAGASGRIIVQRPAGQVRGRIMALRAGHGTSGGVRIFDFLRIRTCFRTVQPENRDDMNDDGAENEKIPNPHPADSDTNSIIANSYLLVHNNTEISNNMQSVENMGRNVKWPRSHHHYYWK